MLASIHRIPDSRWIIKSATVSQEADGKFYTSVLFEFELVENDYILDKTNAIGLDYASDGLYVDSNGIVGSNHKYYRENHRKLVKSKFVCKLLLGTCGARGCSASLS